MYYVNSIQESTEVDTVVTGRKGVPLPHSPLRGLPCAIWCCVACQETKWWLSLVIWNKGRPEGAAPCSTSKKGRRQGEGPVRWALGCIIVECKVCGGENTSRAWSREGQPGAVYVTDTGDPSGPLTRGRQGTGELASAGLALIPAPGRHCLQHRLCLNSKIEPLWKSQAKV